MARVGALDFARVAQDAADHYISDLPDDELEELAMDLLKLFAHAARRLSSDLGMNAIDQTLHWMSEHDDDWNKKHAARLIVAHAQWADVPGVEADLRAHGAKDIDQRFTVVIATGRLVPTISAIPAIWRWLLPELNYSPAGQVLLEKLAEEIM
jgi:hypothetical protein